MVYVKTHPTKCRLTGITGNLIFPGLKGLISETKKKEIQERQSTLEIEKAKEAKLKAHRPQALEVRTVSRDLIY